MVTRESIVESQNRLENLKQSTIVRYTDSIDFDNKLDLYQNMISHLVNGDYDEVFDSPYLKNLNPEERKELMNLVRDYSFLCFYEGNSNYWTESVWNVPLVDTDYICSRLLDNYNFLIRIAKNGGKKALNLLRRFFDIPEYKSSSVIDYLRGSFIDDNILEKTIIDMSSDDSLFNIFSVNQLAELCTVPTGILYFYDSDSIEFTSPLLLAKELYRRDTGIDNETDLKKLVQTVRFSDNFNDLLLDIQVDTLNNSNKYKSIFVDKYSNKSYTKLVNENN